MSLHYQYVSCKKIAGGIISQSSVGVYQTKKVNQESLGPDSAPVFVPPAGDNEELYLRRARGTIRAKRLCHRT
jgi:hypothetical protein